MADDGDIKNVLKCLESLEKSDSDSRKITAEIYKQFRESDKEVRTEIGDIKKQVGDPKEIADLKARVKDLETKLGKMKKQG